MVNLLFLLFILVFLAFFYSNTFFFEGFFEKKSQSFYEYFPLLITDFYSDFIKKQNETEKVAQQQNWLNSNTLILTIGFTVKFSFVCILFLVHKFQIYFSIYFFIYLCFVFMLLLLSFNLLWYGFYYYNKVQYENFANNFDFFLDLSEQKLPTLPILAPMFLTQMKNSIKIELKNKIDDEQESKMLKQLFFLSDCWESMRVVFKLFSETNRMYNIIIVSIVFSYLICFVAI